MSGIDIMQKGRRYLCGDSYGYDLVECLGQPDPSERIHGYGIYVKVKYLNGSQKGQTDVYYCSTGYSTYVEDWADFTDEEGNSLK